MKKILVIGSAVADVIIDLEDHLPRTGEDVHVRTQKIRLGGCGYNTYDIIRHFGVPCIPFFPVGQGAYGDFIHREFAEKEIISPIPRPEEENGCCYCFIEPDGERTFISYHGAEYRFRREWFDFPAVCDVHSIYFCGLEIEEPTGPVIVEFLEKNPDIPAYFAPGPRLMRIAPDLLTRIFALHPILHLNETESMQFTGTDTINQAARALFDRTGNSVIITLGENGCALYQAGSGLQIIPPVPAVQKDTVGAGDAHIGAVLATVYQGHPLPEAIRIANHISSKVVEVSGASLSEAEFAQAIRQSGTGDGSVSHLR